MVFLGASWLGVVPVAPAGAASNVSDEFQRQDLGPGWITEGAAGIVNQSDLGLVAPSPLGLAS